MRNYLISILFLVPSLLSAQVAGPKAKFNLWTRDSLTTVSVGALPDSQLQIVVESVKLHMSDVKAKNESIYIVIDNYVYGGSKREFVALQAELQREFVYRGLNDAPKKNDRARLRSGSVSGVSTAHK